MTLEGMREHLDELKRRLKVTFISFVVLLVIFLAVPADPRSILTLTGTYVPFVSFFLARVKLDLLPPGWILIPNHLNEPLEVYLIASVILAVVFNTPIFAYEVVKFVNPGLTPEERGLVYPFVASSSLLFAVGALFGYFFLAKFLLIAITPFFATAQVSIPIIDVADFYIVIFLTIAFSGVAFMTPIFIYLLIRFGVVDAAFFRRNRVIIWIAAYIITAIITPDGGPLLDVFLFVPIIALLEISVFLAGRRMRPSASPSHSGPQCRYCGALFGRGETFCPACGRSNA